MGTTTDHGETLDVKALSGPALRTFFNIAEKWRLSTDEQLKLLGGLSRATLFNLKKHTNTELYQDTLERISYIVGIYKALQILLPDPIAADNWVRKPNSAPLFHGRSALDQMLVGKVIDLHVVRQYLDGQRGGW